MGGPGARKGPHPKGHGRPGPGGLRPRRAPSHRPRSGPMAGRGGGKKACCSMAQHIGNGRGTWHRGGPRSHCRRPPWRAERRTQPHRAAAACDGYSGAHRGPAGRPGPPALPQRLQAGVNASGSAAAPPDARPCVTPALAPAPPRADEPREPPTATGPKRPAPVARRRALSARRRPAAARPAPRLQRQPPP